MINLIEILSILIPSILLGISVLLRKEEVTFYKPKPKPTPPPANESPEDKEKREKREREEKRRKAQEERKRKQQQDEDFEKIYKPYIFVAATIAAIIIVSWTIVKKITS